MKEETKWIVGSIGAAILLVAGLLAGQIATVSASLNARIDDVNDRIDNLRADVTVQIAGVNTRIDVVRTQVGDEIAALSAAVSSIAARLNAIEGEKESTDRKSLPEQASDPAAPATKDGDRQAEPPVTPAEPARTPQAQAEAAPKAAEPVVSADQRSD